MFGLRLVFINQVTKFLEGFRKGAGSFPEGYLAFVPFQAFGPRLAFAKQVLGRVVDCSLLVSEGVPRGLSSGGFNATA